MGLLRISRICGIVGSIIIIVIGVITTILLVIGLAGLFLGFSLIGHTEKYGDLFILIFIGAVLSGPLPLAVGIGCNRAAFRVLERPLTVGVIYLVLGLVMIGLTGSLWYLLAGGFLTVAGVLALLGYALQPSAERATQISPEPLANLPIQLIPESPEHSTTSPQPVTPRPLASSPMSAADLASFKMAITLAQTGQKEEAYNQLKSLEMLNPTNVNLLLWITFTTPYPDEASRAIEMAASLEPSNPGVRQAREWLTATARSAAIY